MPPLTLVCFLNLKYTFFISLSFSNSFLDINFNSLELFKYNTTSSSFVFIF